MISTILLNILYVFAFGITLVIATFGDVSENSQITSAIAQMANYYTSLNDIFPVNTLLAIIAFDLVFEGAMLIYKLVRWGYQKVPGIT